MAGSVKFSLKLRSQPHLKLRQRVLFADHKFCRICQLQIIVNCFFPLWFFSLFHLGPQAAFPSPKVDGKSLGVLPNCGTTRPHHRKLGFGSAAPAAPAPQLQKSKGGTTQPRRQTGLLMLQPFCEFPKRQGTEIPSHSCLYFSKV